MGRDEEIKQVRVFRDIILDLVMVRDLDRRIDAIVERKSSKI